MIGSFGVETVWWRRFIILSFLKNELIIIDLLAESLWRGCKCTIHLNRKSLKRSEKNWQNALRKSFFFLSILGNVRKTFVPREKICQQGCENCIDRNFGKNLARNEFSLKFVIFLSFPTLSDFLVGTVVKTEIYVSIRTFSVDFFSRRIFICYINFGNRANIFWALWQKVLSRSVKTAL